MLKKEIEDKYHITIKLSGTIEEFDPDHHFFIIRDTANRRRKYKLVLCDFHYIWSYRKTWVKTKTETCPDCKKETNRALIKKVHESMAPEHRSELAVKANAAKTPEQRKERARKAKITYWANKRKFVESDFRSQSGRTPYRYSDRQCKLKKVGFGTAKSFYSENKSYLCGGSSSEHYGLYYEEELVSCISFTRQTKRRWEISRFVDKIGFSVSMGFSKLFNAFIAEHRPVTVVVYDRADITPDYKYSRYNRNGFNYLGPKDPYSDYFTADGYKLPKDKFDTKTLEEDGSIEVCSNPGSHKFIWFANEEE